jgi:type IV pilus assembly protein PilV
MRSMNLAAGATLLEVLIALLVFSFGVLGMIGMQAVSMKSSMDAKYRADAAFLANQLIGHMRVSDPATLALNFAHKPAGAACSPSGTAHGNAANAATPIGAWLKQVVEVLPPHTSAFRDKQQIVVGADNLVTVRLCWQLPQETQEHNYSVTAQIQ